MTNLFKAYNMYRTYAKKSKPLNVTGKLITFNKHKTEWEDMHKNKETQKQMDVHEIYVYLLLIKDEAYTNTV